MSYYGGSPITDTSTGRTGSGVLGGSGAGSVRGRSSSGKRGSKVSRSNTRYGTFIGDLTDVKEALEQDPATNYEYHDWFTDAFNSGVKDFIAGLKGAPETVAEAVESVFGSGDSSSESGSSSGGSRSYGNGLTITAGNAANDYLNMLHQEQERVWQREDTAYQRAVKDMQAAGLNPVLAAGHGVSASGSGSSDSQVVGAVADLAGMAISGLTSTAKGAMALNSMNSSPLSKVGSWYKSNAKTIQTAVNTAASIAKIVALL